MSNYKNIEDIKAMLEGSNPGLTIITYEPGTKSDDFQRIICSKPLSEITLPNGWEIGGGYITRELNGLKERIYISSIGDLRRELAAANPDRMIKIIRHEGRPKIVVSKSVLRNDSFIWPYGIKGDISFEETQFTEFLGELLEQNPNYTFEIAELDGKVVISTDAQDSRELNLPNWCDSIKIYHRPLSLKQ